VEDEVVASPYLRVCLMTFVSALFVSNGALKMRSVCRSFPDTPCRYAGQDRSQKESGTVPVSVSSRCINTSNLPSA
jgi:hypothetical protein